MRGTVRLPWGDQLSQIVQDGLKGGGWPLAYGITASPGPTGQGGNASVCVCVCVCVDTLGLGCVRIGREEQD